MDLMPGEQAKQLFFHIHKYKGQTNYGFELMKAATHNLGWFAHV